MLRRTFTLLLVAGLTLWPAQTGMGAPPVDPCRGTETMCGDGGPATAAFMLAPEGLAVDVRGGVLVADTGNDAIRRVGPDGTIATVAGLGTPGVAGDRGPAVAAQLNLPTDVAAVPSGGYLISDTGNRRIRRVTVRGLILTAAGGGQAAPSTAPAPPTGIALAEPTGVASAGSDFLIADAGLNEVLRVSADGRLRVVAGTGAAGSSGDGGPATQATLNRPTRVLATADGGFDILDLGNLVVRHVAPDGVISTVAGSGFAASSSATGAATPGGLARDDAGNRYLVSDRQVIRVTPGGVAETIAGTGECGDSGDGGPALGAMFAKPAGLAVAANGDVLVLDMGGGFASGTIRRLAAPQPGSIETVAGPNDTGAQPCIGAGGAPTGALFGRFYLTGPRSARVGRGIRITFVTGRSTQVTTTLLRAGRTVRSARGAAVKGPNTVVLTAVKKPGSYLMRIVTTRSVPDNNPDAGGTVKVTKRSQAVLIITR